MFKTIARREVHALFRTPFAWVVLSATTFIIAYQFLAQLELFLEFGERLRALDEPPGATELVIIPTAGLCAFMCLFLTPIVTMQTITGERRLGTLALLYSSPLSTESIVLGKFLGALTPFVVLWSIVAAMLLSLLWGAPIDLGVYAANLLALALLTCACVAIGLFTSSCFHQPSAAGAACFAILLFSWMADWASQLGSTVGWLNYISALAHFQRIAGGLFDSADIAFFVLVTLAGLLLCGWRLRADRLAL